MNRYKVFHNTSRFTGFFLNSIYQFSSNLSLTTLINSIIKWPLPWFQTLSNDFSNLDEAIWTLKKGLVNEIFFFSLWIYRVNQFYKTLKGFFFLSGIFINIWKFILNGLSHLLYKWFIVWSQPWNSILVKLNVQHIILMDYMLSVTSETI